MFVYASENCRSLSMSLNEISIVNVFLCMKVIRGGSLLGEYLNVRPIDMGGYRSIFCNDVIDINN